MYHLYTEQEMDEQRERETWREWWLKSVKGVDSCCLNLFPDEKKRDRDGGGGTGC